MRTKHDYPANTANNVAQVIAHLQEAATLKNRLDYAQNGMLIEYKKSAWFLSRTYKIYIERLSDGAGGILDFEGKKVAGITLELDNDKEYKCLMTANHLIPFLDKFPGATLFMASIWSQKNSPDPEYDPADYTY